jgi:hypothetical protein
MTFDTAKLELLRPTKEVRIRTSGNKGRPVTIWIVVVDDAAFVRSVRGPTAQWFIAATADRRAMLDVGDRQLAVRVIPVTDHGTIEAISNAYLTKYATSSYAKAMVAPDVLQTTLRLDPL